MAINFSNTVNQRIDFGAVAELRSIQKKTFIFLANIDAVTGDSIFSMKGTSLATDEDWLIEIDPTGKIYLIVNWSTTDGLWYANSAITTGLHQISITYDYGSTSNDPVFYVDGASVAITEFDAPVGTYKTGTGNIVRIGSYDTGFNPLDCKLYKLLVYNRIFSASEILEDYNSRLLIPNRNGLIFAPNLLGAAGLQTFDGAALGSSNYIYDMVGGAVGTPTGSPVGVVDNVLNIKA